MLKFNTFGLVKRDIDLVYASFPELSITKNHRVFVRGHKYVLGSQDVSNIVMPNNINCITIVINLEGVEKNDNKTV